MVKDIKFLKEDITKKLKNIMFDTQREILQNTPVDSGRLRQSIKLEDKKDGILISSNIPYALYLEVGTGIFGPKKQRITPKTKKALAWGKDLGTSEKTGAVKKEFVRTSVAGIKPRYFFFNGSKYLENRLKNIDKNK